MIILFDNRTYVLYDGMVADTYRSTLNRPGWISALSRSLGNQVMLVVAPHAANPMMLEMLQAAADQCWVLEPLPEVKLQMKLF